MPLIEVSTKVFAEQRWGIFIDKSLSSNVCQKSSFKNVAWNGANKSKKEFLKKERLEIFNKK